MDNRQTQPRNGACNNYRWDAGSAIKKATSDISINVGTKGVGVSKPITPPHNPQQDAYRNCQNCGKHFNYHGKNDNSYRFGQVNPFKKN